jgi:hypothetical protein
VWALGIVHRCGAAAGHGRRRDPRGDRSRHQGDVGAALNTDPLAYYTDTCCVQARRRPQPAAARRRPARVEPVSAETNGRADPHRCALDRQRLAGRPRQDLSGSRRLRSARDCRRPRPRSASPTSTPRPIAPFGAANKARARRRARRPSSPASACSSRSPRRGGPRSAAAPPRQLHTCRPGVPRFVAYRRW